MADIEDFNNLALAQLGVPYVYGGTTLAGSKNPGLDCSGILFAICKKLGVTIDRTTSTQFASLEPVSPTELRQGDAVYYYVTSDPPPQPAHVAIWWSGTQVLEAPHTGENVKFSPPLPYTIMGYRRLPLASAPAPAPLPVPGDDSMFGELAANKQDNFNATLRHLWNTYRTDNLTVADQQLFWYTYNLQAAQNGFGGSIDALLANLVDGATKDGKIRPSLAGSV